MKYIKKTVIVSIIFSTFLLIALQINKLINRNENEERVLGVSSENIVLCDFINSLAKKYCGVHIQSSTIPAFNIGSSAIKTVSSEIYNVETVSDNEKTSIITFFSKKPFVAKIEYGTTAANLVLVSIENFSTTNHKIYLTSLRPKTTYYFRIRSGNEFFDNGGIPYSFKTK